MSGRELAVTLLCFFLAGGGLGIAIGEMPQPLAIAALTGTVAFWAALFVTSAPRRRR